MQTVYFKRFGTPLLVLVLLAVLWAAAAFGAVSERKRVITAHELELARLNIAVE